MTLPEVALFEDIGCEPNATILRPCLSPLYFNLIPDLYLKSVDFPSESLWSAFGRPPHIRLHRMYFGA